MRDDLKSLPLPPEAKSYARRSGLSAMKKQPQSFIDMNAAVTGQKSKKHGFKNTDEVGTVPKAIKESAACLVRYLSENDGEDDGEDYRVFDAGATIYSARNFGIEVPSPCIDDPTRYANYLKIPPEFTEQQVVDAVETRMRMLAKHRDYPSGSYFVAPWGMYLIHGGTIGKI